jgi:hypothetical protein
VLHCTGASAHQDLVRSEQGRVTRNTSLVVQAPGLMKLSLDDVRAALRFVATEDWLGRSCDGRQPLRRSR